MNIFVKLVLRLCCWFRSKRHLETAKRAVEMAIEEDEQAALEFIKSG